MKRTSKQIKEQIIKLKKERRRIKRNGYTKKWRDKMRKDPKWLKKEHKRQHDYYMKTQQKKFNNGEYP